MTLTIAPDLAARLELHARQQGTSPEQFALRVLADRVQMLPKEEFERLLREVGSPCGVALSDAALSSDGLYD